MKISPLKDLAIQLKLHGIAESLEKRVEEAGSESQTAPEFLTRIFEDEFLHRRNNSALNLEKKASFRRRVILEKLETSAERGLSKTKLRELASFNFWDNKKNLIIVGPTGVGKTELSLALGRAGCQNQLSVQFLSVEILFQDVLTHKSSGRLHIFTKKLKAIDILILDDFGLRNYTHEEAVFLVGLKTGTKTKSRSFRAR
jgi:DNA replication protein DnaC